MSKKIEEFFKPKTTIRENQKSVESVDSNTPTASENLKIKEHEHVTVKDFSPDYQDIGSLKDSHTDLNSFQVKKAVGKRMGLSGQISIPDKV